MTEPPNTGREREERLIAGGLRGDLAAYLSQFEPRPRLAGTLGYLQLLIMVGGFVAGIPIFRTLEAEANRRALADAAASNALLYDTNFGFSLLIAVFAWICVSAVIAGAIPLLFAKETQAALAAKGLLDSLRHPATAALTRRSLSRLPAHYRPEDLIAQIMSGWLRGIAAVGFGLAALAGIALDRELDTHTLFTERAVIRAPFWPWSQAGARSYEDATRVELGCNHVTGRNRSDDIKYVIHFADGADFNLYSATPVAGGWLEQAERIDARLVEASVHFERWKWLGRDPLHPACLATQRSREGVDRAARIDRLLRVGDAALAPRLTSP